MTGFFKHHFGKQNINKCIEVYKDSWSGIFFRCRKVQFRAHLQMQRLSGWSHALGEGFAGFTVAVVSASALRQHSLLLDNGGEKGARAARERDDMDNAIDGKAACFLFFFLRHWQAEEGHRYLLNIHSSFNFIELESSHMLWYRNIWSCVRGLERTLWKYSCQTKKQSWSSCIFRSMSSSTRSGVIFSDRIDRSLWVSSCTA